MSLGVAVSMLCDVTSHWAVREPDESSTDAKAKAFHWRQGACRMNKAVLGNKPLPADVRLIRCRSCGVSTCSQCYAVELLSSRRA